MDWRQLWEICSAPDNVPIVGLIPLLAFYIYLAVKQARANDQLIEQLEADPAMAKTHHRKTWPFKPGWAKEVHVWPFLLRIEFLAAIIITIILMVWSITLNAPLEEPANPNLTMNPAKAPWYFLGLQEMLVYFDPWIAGVVMPTLIIIGLMVIPYIDTNPLGSGYYTWKQRKFSISTFLVRLHHSLDLDDHHRHVHSRAGMAVVLAGTNLGSQPVDLRSEPGFAGFVWTYVQHGESDFRGHRRRRILSAGRCARVFSVPPKNAERFSAHEPAAVFAHGISMADHDCIAIKDGSAAFVAHQVCVDYTLVQCIKPSLVVSR